MSRAGGRAILAATFAACVALACGGSGNRPEEPDREVEFTGGMALPPSAGAPHASQPARSPDTVRPAADSVADVPLEDGRRRAPEELDLGAIVNAYMKHYREEYAEMGSEVRGGVDPKIVEAAKRRVALEWGYVEVGAWSDLLGDMTRDQRAVLANRIAAANETLATELHARGAPGPP